MSTLKRSPAVGWAPVSQSGRISRSAGVAFVPVPEGGAIARSSEITVDTEDQVAIIVSGVTQRLWPDGHLAEVSGKLYGTGIYDPIDVTFVSLEKATDSGGPWVAVTPRTSDPSHLFPAQADEAGAAFLLVVEPDEWTETTLWFRLTVNFDGIGDEVSMGGPFPWIASILPGYPAWIVVPLLAPSGSYSIEWSPVDGASGYEVSEGEEQPDTSIVWGSYFDVGDVTTYGFSGKPIGKYWYRVRTYNPHGNRSSATTSSNGCKVEQPCFKISPDLSWPNVDSMMDALLNPMVSSWPFASLEVVLTAPSRYKGRDTLIFEFEGVRYKLPPEAIDSLGGSTRHIVRPTGGEIDWFMLTRQSMSAGEPTQELTWSRQTTTPRILS